VQLGVPAAHGGGNRGIVHIFVMAAFAEPRVPELPYDSPPGLPNATAATNPEIEVHETASSIQHGALKQLWSQNLSF
jgi:hypothetical protein